MIVEQNNKQEQNVWSLYLFALKSPVTREKYQKRLERFFNFLGLDGRTTEEKSDVFIEKAKTEGNQWAFNAILKFMQFHLERVNRKEITGVKAR